MMDRYVVFGNPIGHSKSPMIHRLFAEQTGQAWTTTPCWRRWTIQCLRPAFFQEGRRQRHRAVQGRGLPSGDSLTARAQRAGAVNTLSKLADGSLLGDNTDGAGLVRDLTVNAGFSLTGKRILLLGAGGAVRGVLEPLAEKPASVIIANRTVDKAELLAELCDLGPVSASGFDWLQEPVDVIINATSASLSGDVPPIAAA
jgi:shikimate dehydrogenase